MPDMTSAMAISPHRYTENCHQAVHAAFSDAVIPHIQKNGTKVNPNISNPSLTIEGTR